MNTSYNSIIAFLRFPLTLLVVFIHVPFNSSSVLCNNLHKFWIEGVCSIAVPTFFFISGYLFFTKDFSCETYRSKLKRRIKTLLIPYIAWNFLALLAVVIPHYNDYNYSALNILAAFINTKYSFLNTVGESPIDYPLWYIRDLMVCCILSPLFYFVRRLNIFIPLIFWVLWILGISLPIGTSSIAICFFSLGGVIRIYGFPFENHPFGYIFVSLILMLAYVISGLELILHNAVMPILVLSLFPIGKSFLPESVPILFHAYGKVAFVIYAAHAIFIKKIWNILIDLDLSHWLVYVMTYILAIVICVFLDYIAKKILPQLYGILTGTR